MPRRGDFGACAVFRILEIVLSYYSLGSVMANETLFTTFHMTTDARAEGRVTTIVAGTLVRCATECHADSLCNVAQYWSVDHTCDLFDGMSADIVYPLLNEESPRTVLIKTTLQAFYVRREDRASMTYAGARAICVGLGGTMATRGDIENTYAAFPFQKQTCCFYEWAGAWGVQVGIHAYNATMNCYHAFMEVYCKVA